MVYDVELKVSSLSGLRFLFQQQQRLATKYPHSEILISHMVSFPLRQNVLATYNSRRYDQFIRNGEEPEELMCEKWLTFDNKLVLEILVEACRPRISRTSLLSRVSHFSHMSSSGSSPLRMN